MVSLGVDDQGSGCGESSIRVELERIVGQCQRLGEQGLTDALQGRVRAVAQLVADLVAGAEGAPCRQMPVVRPLAVVHQLQVAVGDALRLADDQVTQQVASAVLGLRQELSAAVSQRSKM